MKRALLERLQELRATKRPVALMTALDSGTQALITPDGVEGELQPGPDMLRAARAALARNESGFLAGTETIFVQVFTPPLRLVLVGAVHISQALVPMARLAGYDVIVVDPRRTWASAERFPDVAITTGWPDEALAALDLDRRSAVVTLAHDAKLDDPALAAALRSEAFYIGALGSKRTHARRLARLREQGFTEWDLARIHGPVGLALGASSPAEIAVSVLAEVTQVLHGAPPLAPRAPRVGAIILAAGRSARMGPANKLLAEIDGKPMIARVTGAALASRGDPVVVVTGHDRGQIEAALAGLGPTFAHNPAHASGLSGSLHRGLAALPADVDGAVFVLGDMPLVSAGVIDRLIAAFDPLAGKAICLPTWQGKRGNPVLFARRFFAEIQSTSGDEGARALIGAYPDAVCEVPMPDDGVLTDVDTPEGLAALTSAG